MSAVVDFLEMAAAQGRPVAVVVGGVHGVGKRTFHKLVLERTGLPTVGVEAGAQFAQQVEPHVAAKQSFILHSALSDMGLGRWLGELRSRGYAVLFVSLTVDAVDIAMARVAARVAHGGPAAPPGAFDDRMGLSRATASILQSSVDHVLQFDNSRADLPFRCTAGG